MNENLATYLKDHLAGSVGALEVLDGLISGHGGQAIVSFFQEAKDEIESDQNQLQEVMKALNIEEGSVRKAGAWIGEKLSRIKLSPGSEGIGLAQSLESLVLGIKGKELLWRALAAVQKSWLELEPFDFERLIRRAQEQAARVEAKGLQVAGDLFRA